MTTTMSKTNWFYYQNNSSVRASRFLMSTALLRRETFKCNVLWGRAYFFLNLDKDLKSSTPGKSAKWKTTQIHFQRRFLLPLQSLLKLLQLYLLQSELCVVFCGFDFPASIRKRCCNLHYLVTSSFFSISFDNQISCMLSRQALGNLNDDDDDDDGSENITKKMNLRSFKLYSVYLESLNSSNLVDFSWT